MPTCCYTVLAMVRDDLDSLPPRAQNILDDMVRGAYADDPDNWKPFGDNVPICRLVDSAGLELGIRFESLSRQLLNDPSHEELFRIFALTDVYIIDCLSLELARVAALASKVELAVHRRAAFFVPLDFGDGIRRRMRNTWKQKLPLLDFASDPSGDMAPWRNRNIYLVSFVDELKRRLKDALDDLERRRTAGWPGAGEPTKRGHEMIDQLLAEEGITQGPPKVPRPWG
jgi:hypothetical protein